MTEIISVLVPVGMLGVGVQADEVKRGIAAGADVIAQPLSHRSMAPIRIS
jgi:hypothetical protein